MYLHIHDYHESIIWIIIVVKTVIIVSPVHQMLARLKRSSAGISDAQGKDGIVACAEKC